MTHEASTILPEGTVYSNLSVPPTEAARASSSNEVKRPGRRWKAVEMEPVGRIKIDTLRGLDLYDRRPSRGVKRFTKTGLNRLGPARSARNHFAPSSSGNLTRTGEPVSSKAQRTIASVQVGFQR